MKRAVNLNDSVLRPWHTVGQAQVRLSADRPARAAVLDVAGDVAPHDHAYHEVCVVLAGRATHHTPAYAVAMTPGTAVVVPPGGVHAMTDVACGFRVVNVYYLAEWLTADLELLWQQDGLVPLFLAGTLFAARDVPQFQLEPPELAAVARDLEDLAAEADTVAPSPVLLRAALLKALARLARAHARAAPRASGPFLSPAVWAAMTAVEARVAAGEPLDLATAADATGVSPDHLTRLFRRATGRAVTDYYQHRRVHRACQLLLDPRRSVTGVAHALGYADGPHLSRLFRRYRGMTPRAYRQMYLVT